MHVLTSGGVRLREAPVNWIPSSYKTTLCWYQVKSHVNNQVNSLQTTRFSCWPLTRKVKHAMHADAVCIVKKTLLSWIFWNLVGIRAPLSVVPWWIQHSGGFHIQYIPSRKKHRHFVSVNTINGAALYRDATFTVYRGQMNYISFNLNEFLQK